MRIRFTERTPGQIDLALLFGGIALAALLAFSILPIASLLPACIWHGITGVPCPTCGATRSLIHLSRGEIATSFSFNPLASIAIISLVLSFFASVSSRVLFAQRLTMAFSGREKDGLRVAVITLFLLNWSYLVMSGI